MRSRGPKPAAQPSQRSTTSLRRGAGTPARRVHHHRLAAGALRRHPASAEVGPCGTSAEGARSVRCALGPSRSRIDDPADRRQSSRTESVRGGQRGTKSRRTARATAGPKRQRRRRSQRSTGAARRWRGLLTVLGATRRVIDRMLAALCIVIFAVLVVIVAWQVFTREVLLTTRRPGPKRRRASSSSCSPARRRLRVRGARPYRRRDPREKLSALPCSRPWPSSCNSR